MRRQQADEEDAPRARRAFGRPPRPLLWASAPPGAIVVAAGDVDDLVTAPDVNCVIVDVD